MSRSNWSRESRHARGYGSAWDKLRKQILARDFGLCQPCRRKGELTLATQVHHVRAKADGGDDSPENLESICDACHERVTIEAKGGRPKTAFDHRGLPISPDHPWNRQ